VDNADERLTPIGRRVGLATEPRWEFFTKKQMQKALLLAAMARSRSPNYLSWLKQPEARIVQILDWVASVLGEPPVRGLLTTVETEIKYAGYMAQQEKMLGRLRDAERRKIPEDFRFTDIPGLSREVRETMERVRPITLGQAGRIPGVTPAAIAVLDVYLSLARRN
jgi:tRNA uridine 5-carboxymethylaminomethyl modification enzyme